MSVSPFIIGSFVGGSFGSANGILQRKQQEKLAKANQKFQEDMQRNKQDFDLAMHESNIAFQRELSRQNHKLRLEEQWNQFNLTCNQANYQFFLKRWPLINLPEIIREEQLLSDNTVALRVIFSKCNDAIFSKIVNPSVEQGLLEFVDLYHNTFNSKNIIFYHNGFIGDITGGAIVTNIHHALKELPVVVIDTAVLEDEVCISFSMWGFGNSEQRHETVFKMPYRPMARDGKIVPEYYAAIVEKILAHLKFLLGYSYDVYNLLEYNRAPLLPAVASYEMENSEKVRGIMLKDKEIETAIENYYEDLYSKIIGTKDSVAMLPEYCKETTLYKLRAEYAQATKGFVQDTLYFKSVEESLDAWTNLRSSLSAEDFLKSIISGESEIKKYFSNDDKEYFFMLSELYKDIGGERAALVYEVCNALEQVQLEKIVEAIPAPVAKADTDTNKRDKFKM